MSVYSRGYVRYALFILLLVVCPAALALPVGVVSVSPAPAAVNVPADTALSITFTVPASYAYTDNRKLRVIESATGVEAFSVDPDAGDPQAGELSYDIDLPVGTLRHGTAYHVTLDQGFANINEAPWKSGAHDGSEWFFTTAALAPVTTSFANISSVFPPLGATGVSVDSGLTLTFPAPASFAYTENRYLVVRDVASQVVVFEADPAPGDAQEGTAQFHVPVLPLQPGRLYEVTLDYAFAGINVAPWKTAAIQPGVWQFETGAAPSAALMSTVDGLIEVSPAPGSTGVRPDTSLSLHFSSDLMFANTDQNTLRVIDVSTAEVVFELDPDENHVAHGSRNLHVQLPAGVLTENASYAVVMDYQFTYFNSAPWRNTTLAEGGWTFTTGQRDPMPLAQPSNGVVAVYPAPGSTGVPANSNVAVYMEARTMFSNTDGGTLSLVDTRNESVIASADPLYLDAQEGRWSYLLPVSSLEQGVEYRAELAYAFSRFNVVPWVSGQAEWSFTIAGIAATPPEVEEPEAPPEPEPEPEPEPPTEEPVDPVAGGEPPVEPETPTLEPAGPQVTQTTGTVLFVTQTPTSGTSFGTVINNFSNHSPTSIRAPRGGDLWIRYPDGTLRNLTAEAGYGEDGLQGMDAIAARTPSVHWDGDRAIFSMVVGSPDLYETTSYYWQMYEVSGLAQGEQATITKVPNQPADYNNVSAIYSATGNDIIFVSDITPGGRHLYPQYEEYDGAVTNTGLFRLTPATGEVRRLTHAPSGDFTPLIDGFGRMIFVRWDHLQRDQQNGSLIGGVERFGAAINYVDESPGAIVDTVNGAIDVFPEHLVELDPATSVPYVVGNETGHRFNQFFLWESSPLDGSHNEVLNHLGRQELGQSYTRGRFVDDPALNDITSSVLGGHTANTVSILAPGGTFHPKEDPNVPGAFVMTHAQEFAFCGELVYVEAAPGVNPEVITFEKLTEYFGADPIDGCYRNPLPLADDVLVAAWSPFDFGNQSGEGGGFRLRFVNEDGTPGGYLTDGIAEAVSYYNPDFLVGHNGNLWELDPVEVRARPRPNSVIAQSTQLEAPEQQACEAAFGSANACENGMAAFRDYLVGNKLALVVSRNVTSRDDADTQQPFNLRVPGGVTSDSSFGLEKVYDVTHLQFLQANLVRGYANRPNGRRPLAQYVADDIADGLNDSLEGAVAIGNDGSVAAVVPAERAVTWHLVDETQGNQSVVSERYWVSFAPGEVRVCANCHGINDQDQMGNPPPTNPPSALTDLLGRWLANQAPTE